LEETSQGAAGRVTLTYVFDTGALISAERGKERASRFLRLVRIGRARILIPLPVIAEWWRGRSDAREEILAACRIVASLSATKAAGVALARFKDVQSNLTIDAIVMATAAFADAIVVTGDPTDFERLSPHFPGVVVLSA
jgi:predicted nucleic acid-binding protein